MTDSGHVDSGHVILLALLDQSSAFDVIDHGILIDRLRHLFGFAGVVLEWVRSYVTERSQYVHFNGESSNVVHLECGVPQGSVLGPLLYILYTADLTSIVDNHQGRTGSPNRPGKFSLTGPHYRAKTPTYDIFCSTTVVIVL